MKNRIKNLPMQKKMMLTFAVPIILLCGILFGFGYVFLNIKYENQIEYSLEQSCRQAGSFIDSYLQDMEYLSFLTCVDSELQSILSASSFGQDEDFGVAYREFYQLDKRLAGIELSNSRYRIGIYVPDDAFYSSNQSHTYPKSQLKEIKDYDDVMKKLRLGGQFITTGQESETGRPRSTYKTLVIYRMIFSLDNPEQELCVCKVSIDIKYLQEVLDNANVTQYGSSFLINERGDKIIESFKKPYQIEDIKTNYDGSRTGDNEEILDEINKKYYSIFEPVADSRWTLITVIPKAEIARQARQVGWFFLILGISMTVIVITCSQKLSAYYVNRLSSLRNKMNQLQEGNINTGFNLDGSVVSGDEITNIYQSFNYMVEKLRVLMKEHYRLGKSVMSAELKALQAQINPHFLYNTLDLINWTAMDYGSPEIAQIAQSLAKYYRLNLNYGKNIISIRNELAHVNAYIEIENFHFEHAIFVEENIPEELLDFACPNIIIQPFVENSIVHGIAESPEITECNIQISAREIDNDIIFTIKDDGKGISEAQIEEIIPEAMDQSSKGYGVKNINFRLKLYFGEQYGVKYECVNDEGTVVHIKIPKLTMEEAERIINE